MKNFLNKTTSPPDRKSALGTEITSWVYRPPKSNRFLLAALGVVGTFILFMMYYGEQVLPWIKKLPSVLIYIVLFMLSPLLKYLSNLGREQEWALYSQGYLLRLRGKNNQREERIGWWRDFASCSYDNKGVLLISKSPMRRNVRLSASHNVMEVYAICRERISMIHTETVERLGKTPLAPKGIRTKRIPRSPQQRRW